MTLSDRAMLTGEFERRPASSHRLLVSFFPSPHRCLSVPIHPAAAVGLAGDSTAGSATVHSDGRWPVKSPVAPWMSVHPSVSSPCCAVCVCGLLPLGDLGPFGFPPIVDHVAPSAWTATYAFSPPSMPRGTDARCAWRCVEDDPLRRRFREQWVKHTNSTTPALPHTERGRTSGAL